MWVGEEQTGHCHSVSEGSAPWEVTAQTHIPRSERNTGHPLLTQAPVESGLKAEVQMLKACLGEASCAHDFFLPSGLNPGPHSC